MRDRAGGISCDPVPVPTKYDAFGPEAAADAPMPEGPAKANRDALKAAMHAAGFRVNQLGRSYTLDLGRFTTAGTRFMQLRNKVNRARVASRKSTMFNAAGF